MSNAPTSPLPAAYAFKLDLPLGQLRAQLNSSGPWNWVDGDSARHGDYIGAQATPYGGVVRIYVEADHFVVVVKYPPATAGAARALKAHLRDVFLSGLGARDIVPHDGLD